MALLAVGGRPDALFEVFGWREVAEGRQILFVLTDGPRYKPHMLKSGWLTWTVRDHNSAAAQQLSWPSLSCCSVCVWSHLVQVLLEHLGEGGSRGVEFVRNPRPKFIKNSQRQVSATPWCYVWLSKYSMWRVPGWAGFCPVPCFPHAFLQASCFLRVQKLLAKIKLNTDSPWFIMLS